MLTIKTYSQTLNLFFCCILLVPSYAITSFANNETNKNHSHTIRKSLSDKPLAEHQEKLLDLAFEVAASIPLEPHIKTRSKTQQEVIEVCLELDQPKRALEYTEEIKNWRQGYCYAALAFYCAKNANVKPVQFLLKLAEECADKTEDWRRDRIQVKIAQTLARLGQTEKAEHIEANVVPSEKGKVDRVKAMMSEDESFEEQMKMLNEMIASNNFDIVKNAMHVCTTLFDLFYTDTDRRSKIENKMKNTWEDIPGFIRIELVIDLIESALDHSDNGKALALVNEATTMLEKYDWTFALEKKISMASKLAELRYQAGDKEHALAKANEILALYQKRGKRIVNIWRAGALRPLAEAYRSMGKRKQALNVYALALEEGVKNPNSRPRAEDLSATCASMALYSVKPDAALWKQIHQIQKNLDHPW